MLKPYARPLSEYEARYLLRRCAFALTQSSVAYFTGMDSSQAVDILLSNAATAAIPSAPDWDFDGFESFWKFPADKAQEILDAAYTRMYEENYELKRWWIEQMSADTHSLREKMTLFWHGHFTTQFAKGDLMPAQLMHIQNQLFRENHQGNFRTLVEKICLDGAMLIYLNGQDSTKEAPNENFSRELLELYTTGIGNYTEEDIKEGARVFTGWKVNIFRDEWKQYGILNPFLFAEQHDFGQKSYLGQQINSLSESAGFADVVTGEISRLVDIILTERADAVSNFICKKLYRYFIYSNESAIDMNVVSELASVFRTSNWEIRPVLEALLKSEYFFSETTRGNQIKTPAELIVGLTHHFDVEGSWKEWEMVTMGQELFNPPNVAGWPGYRKWTDTRTFPFAVQQCGYFVWNQENEYMLEWVNAFKGYEDPFLLTRQILALFLVKAPTDELVEKYKQTLLFGSPDYEWPNILHDPEAAGLRLKNLIIQIIKLPDFHLS